MARSRLSWPRLFPWAVACAAAACALGPLSAWADYTLLMKDGRKLNGKVATRGKVATNSPDDVRTITYVDNDLTHVLVPTARIDRIVEVEGKDQKGLKGKINLSQPVANNGKRILKTGPIIKITPFDDFGHRTLSMMTDKGQLDVVQGISQITPLYTRVDGLVTKKLDPVVWDMRIATNSIPLETLKTILARYIVPTNLEQRLMVVRLFMNMELLPEAQEELEKVLVDFPAEAQLKGEVDALRQKQAQRIIEEAKLRKKSGQHEVAHYLLAEFPSKDVAGVILAEVKELLEEYEKTAKRFRDLEAELKGLVEKVGAGRWKDQSAATLKELVAELNINTLDRMAAYLQFHDDDKLSPEQKLALAFSGWVLGTNQAHTNLAMALSQIHARDMVANYLLEPNRDARKLLQRQIQGQEGVDVSTVASMLKMMVPPIEDTPQVKDRPGLFAFQAKLAVDQNNVCNVLVQVPPGYDSHVHYPAVVTLNGSATPEQQIDWWAGACDKNGNRLGQATRFGYIVVAVDWSVPGQRHYEFSAREHAAVLTSLREACRRFAIDTDRVFLSGHSQGGNAAWDIGLSHPDLWAGVIPIVAQAERYCTRYAPNAKLLPFYVLGGYLDGNRMVENGPILDKYMTGGCDVTVTVYTGRGHEDFYEDILNIFEWMNRRTPRDLFPKKFTVKSMRTWDTFFYWGEFDGQTMPARAVVEPTDWPPAPNQKELEIKGSVGNNSLNFTCGGSAGTIWLTPDVVDFKKPITINGKLQSGNKRIEPDLGVLLEDARSRADRQHPFWAKVDI